MSKFEQYLNEGKLNEMTEKEMDIAADIAMKKYRKLARPILEELAHFYGFEGTMDIIQDDIRDIEPIVPEDHHPEK